MSSLLAFDTATEHMSVGLCVGRRRWVHEGEGGAQASVTLIPTVMDLLSQAGIGLRDLDAIAFGRGPGAFTGLRTACSVAQGLAFGADKPVLCIDTLQVVAEDARVLSGSNESADPWVVMDARMSEIYAARYRYEAGRWTTVVEPALYTLEALNLQFEREPPTQLAGTAIDAFGDQLQSGAATRVAGALPRANALLSIAEVDWQDGLAVDAALALPVYVRDKVALTTVERDAVRAAKTLAAASIYSAAVATGALPRAR
ncbi:tRNA (adenosine(37)-N6)-threonylcarbamoyltransferase complex dimerization subunit type 1 TsaB [soil metagenome]